MFPALFPHLGAVILQRTFLHRHGRRLRVASPRGLAWQFPKILHTLFRPQPATEKSPRDPARRGSVTFFSVANFWSVSGLLYFGKPPCLIKKARLNAQEGAGPQPSSELEGASASIRAARFACRLLVFTARTGSRLSTSRYGFGVSCMRPLRCPPPMPRSFFLQGSRTLASEGGFV